MCRKNCHWPLCDRWCEIRMQYTIISSLWLVSCFLDLMHIDECYLCGQRCAFIVDSEAVLALPFSWAVVLFSPLSYVVWPHTIAPSHCVKSSVETEKKRKKKAMMSPVLLNTNGHPCCSYLSLWVNSPCNTKLEETNCMQVLNDEFKAKAFFFLHNCCQNACSWGTVGSLYVKE